MDRAKLWIRTYRISLGLLERNREGLDDAQAGRRPAPGAPCPAWILGHLLRARQSLLKALGQPPAADPALDAACGRGSAGDGAHLPFSELCEAFKATDGPLKEAFLAVPDWERPQLNPGLGKEQSLEEVVAFLFMHESYHLGQIAVVRKLLGLGGAI